MDFDDFFDDGANDKSFEMFEMLGMNNETSFLQLDNFFDMNYIHSELEHEQSLISKKETTNIYSVEANYINSYKFHEKFEKLPISKDLQEMLYKETGRLLEFVDNLKDDQIGTERMTAINSRTCEFIVDNFNRNGSKHGTFFNAEETQKINDCSDMITVIHNHSENGPPSGQDLLTYLHDDKIKLSIIACHNGDVYAICNVNKSFEEKYLILLGKEKDKTTEIELAKRRATTKCYDINDSLSERHKLFNVMKL